MSTLRREGVFSQLDQYPADYYRVSLEARRVTTAIPDRDRNGAYHRSAVFED
jgi:hypothetical protein